MVEAIKGCGEFSSACHLGAISKVRHESGNAFEDVANLKLDTILETLSRGMQTACNQEDSRGQNVDGLLHKEVSHFKAHVSGQRLLCYLQLCQIMVYFCQ